MRQKWINDTYQLLKSILPPKAIDTAEELAQLSQYVINIVDFRDTDCTMTHWMNPDVVIAGVPVPATGGTVRRSPTTARHAGRLGTPTSRSRNLQPLDQWGMEYNPVAINEVLAYSFLYNTPAGGTNAGQPVLVELVNTQTSPEISMRDGAPGFNPVLDLGGYVYNTPPCRRVPSIRIPGRLGHHLHG